MLVACPYLPQEEGSGAGTFCRWISMIALSTLWNSRELVSGQEILSQIRDVGFEAIELDCYLTGAKLNEIRPFSGTNMQVVSIQNFCPVPDILPKGMAGSDAFLLSSCDKEERERAVEYTVKTIELADTVDARIVICHFGYVDIKDPTEKLIELYNKGERESSDFEFRLEEARNRREAEQQRNLDAVFSSLDRLIKRAESLDIFIGIENRREFRQIPNSDEIEIILSEFSGANIAYWHNTGYAQIQEHLGLVNHEDFLKQYSNRMIGIHLNDVKSTEYGLAPGMGDLDFKMVSEYLSENVVKVMQLSPEATREQIADSLAHLQGLGIL